MYTKKETIFQFNFENSSVGDNLTEFASPPFGDNRGGFGAQGSAAIGRVFIAAIAFCVFWDHKNAGLILNFHVPFRWNFLQEFGENHEPFIPGRCCLAVGDDGYGLNAASSYH